MRNSEFLDLEKIEDKVIGELQEDFNGLFRVVDGKKIYQIKEQTQEDRDLNLTINRVRASGMTPSQYLKSQYGY